MDVIYQGSGEACDAGTPILPTDRRSPTGSSNSPHAPDKGNVLRKGTFLGRIPYIEQPGRGAPLLVVNGGQGFVRRPSAASAERDLRRVARLFPSGSHIVLLGYDPDPPAPLSSQDLANDIARIVDTRWGHPVTLIGISYGGPLAARASVNRPELVDRLILLSSAHRLSAEGRVRVRRQIELLGSGRPVAFVDEFAAVFRRRWLNALLRFRLRLARRALAKTLAEPELIIRYLRALIEDSPLQLERIRAPTLLAAGTEDQFFGKEVIREAATRIPSLVLDLLDGETHMAPVERSKDVAKAICRFLD